MANEDKPRLFIQAEGRQYEDRDGDLSAEYAGAQAVQSYVNGLIEKGEPVDIFYSEVQADRGRSAYFELEGIGDMIESESELAKLIKTDHRVISQISFGFPSKQE